MEELILDNQNFIYYLFNLTAGFLQALSLLTGLSYQWWNIVIWFGIIPAVWVYMIGRKTTPLINLLSVALFALMFYKATWNKWFDQAVIFLNDLCRFLGPDYRQMSVYVCVFIPVFITIVLGYLCLSPKQNKFLRLFFSVITILTIIGYPVSNYLLSKYGSHFNEAGKQYKEALQILK